MGFPISSTGIHQLFPTRRLGDGRTLLREMPQGRAAGRLHRTWGCRGQFHKAVLEAGLSNWLKQTEFGGQSTETLGFCWLNPMKAPCLPVKSH